MEDITTYIEDDEKYIVLDDEKEAFIDITMPKRGQNITLKDQDEELYSITNITEE